MEKMNFIPADDMRDELWGPVGTPERDEMEAQLAEDVKAYFEAKSSISHKESVETTLSV